MRELVPELMDDPSLPAEQHFAALRGLARINRISRSAAIYWPALQKLTGECLGRPVRVLDIACGGADVTIALARRAARRGLPFEWRACDVSGAALRFAALHAARANVQIELFELDVLRDGLPRQYDAVICSLFLHHLVRHDAILALRKMAGAAARVLLVNDLRRCAHGTLLAHAASRMLSGSHVVHVDAMRSARAAFTIAECIEMAHQAGLVGCTLARRWPARFLLEWWRP